MKERLKRLAQGLLLATAAVILTLLALEIVVRWLAPQQLVDFRRDIWQPKDGVGWHHAPNADAQINTGERDVRFRTDADGHRRGEQTPPTDGWRVLALGDSFLEAVQVNHEDTLTAHLENGLTQAFGPGRVVNTGVGGWSPNQYLIEARAELARTHYDAVAVFFFVGNDVIPTRKDDFAPRPSAEQAGFHWPRSFNRRGLINAFAYPLNNTLEARSHLFILAKNRLKFLLMRVGLSAHYFPAMLRAEYLDYSGWDTSADIVRDIVALAADQGLPTVVALLPGVYQVNLDVSLRYQNALGIDPATVDYDQPSTLLLPRLTARGVEVIDTLPALRAAHEAGVGPLYGHVDTHFAPEGHRVAAEAVLPTLREPLRVALAQPPVQEPEPPSSAP